MTTLNTIVAIPVYSMPVDDARAQSVSLVQIVTNADTYIHINNCIVLGIPRLFFGKSSSYENGQPAELYNTQNFLSLEKTIAQTVTIFTHNA